MISKSDRVIRTIKHLSIDMMNKIKFAYPDTMLRSSNLLYELYAKVMIVNPKKPNWINRDRLIVSPKYSSAMLYATLHLAGYDISKEDLENYCIKEKTSGSLNPKNTPGVDAPDGVPGEGIARAVGMALAEKYLANVINKKQEIINYNVYVVCGIDDINSGIAQEALALAGEYKLNNLFIIFQYHKEEVMKDHIFFKEDVDRHFRTYKFNVISMNDRRKKFSSLLNRHLETKYPTAIIVDNNPGLDLMYQSLSKIKGDAITEKDYKKVVKKLNMCEEPFKASQDAFNIFQTEISKRCDEEYNLWEKDYEEYLKTATSEEKNILESLEKNELIIDFNSKKFKIKDNYCDTLLKSNLEIMKIINRKNRLFVGGSDDLDLCKSNISQESFPGAFDLKSPAIDYHNRMLSMGSISNGLALCGLRPFNETKLIYSDMFKSSIRLDAILKIPSIYIFTHDMATNESKGAVYSPIDHIGALRSIPGVNVFRPADVTELFGVWEIILKTKDRPSVILLGDEAVKKEENTKSELINYGAYILKREIGPLDFIIVSSGNDIQNALDVSNNLGSLYSARVVSMPSMNLFLEQSDEYKKMIFPKNAPVFIIESGKDLNWLRFVPNIDYIIGVKKYNKCGTLENILEYHEMTKEQVITKIQKML